MEELYAIAVSKELNSNNELDIYVYKDNRIYLYSPQWELDTSWNYDEKIKDIALDVDDGLLDWVDVYIEDGQEITVADNQFYINDQKVEPFKRLSEDIFANVGVVSAKIYNEFLASKDSYGEHERNFLKESFEDGLFLREISNIIETEYQSPIETNELNDLDKQIIIRTKIEGYNFAVNFVKGLLQSELEEKEDYCIMFLNRVLMLESQNFIKL